MTKILVATRCEVWRINTLGTSGERELREPRLCRASSGRAAVTIGATTANVVPLGALSSEDASVDGPRVSSHGIRAPREAGRANQFASVSVDLFFGGTTLCCSLSP